MILTIMLFIPTHEILSEGTFINITTVILSFSPQEI